MSGSQPARRKSSTSAVPIPPISASFAALQLQQHPSQAGPYDQDALSISNSPPSTSFGAFTRANGKSSTSPHSATSPASRNRTLSNAPSSQPKQLTSFVPAAPMEEHPTIRVLLLENVNESAITMMRDQKYEVDTETASLGEDALIERLRKGRYQALGIRSKTKVTRKVIESAQHLLVVGCFCIGTNQVDLSACAKAGIAVFNSPFSNSRSVAELVISELVALSRQLCDRANEMRAGTWNKVSKRCYEIRGKTLGIVGYGHIGAQLSVLAEAMAMDVVFFDVVPIMPLGSARQLDSLDELLEKADFVTLHVPELPETIDLIGRDELARMKKGAFLINNARGKVVDLGALAEALASGHLGGAAIDVFPREPAANGPHFNDSLGPFAAALAKQPNVILTPHIGGSTEEAQRMIGAEVGLALIRYLNFGSTVGAVNLPEVTLRPIISEGFVRLCHMHQNQPGVLKAVNAILGDFNVERQLSDSKGDVAYLMADIADVSQKDIKTIYESIAATSAAVATRVLY